MVSSFHIRNLNTHRGRLITMKDHQSFYPFHRSSISIPSKETKLLAALEPDTNIIGKNFLDSDEFWRLIVLGIAFLWATNSEQNVGILKQMLWLLASSWSMLAAY